MAVTVLPMLLSVNKDQSNNYITINDITDYVGSGIVAADLCRMLFYSKDAFASDFNLDQGNPSDYQWMEPVLNNNTYSIATYASYKWVPGANVDYVQGQFTFDAGAFYLLKTNTTINSTSGTAPSLDATNWGRFAPGLSLVYKGTTYASLTAEDCYAILYAPFMTPPLTNYSIWYGVNQIQLAGPLFTLQKVGCHQWQLIKNNSYTVGGVFLMDYDRTTELKSYAMGSNSGDMVPINLDTDGKGDGVYVIRIMYTHGSGNAVASVLDMPLYDLCAAYQCYMELFDWLMCHCDDPCDDCKEEDKSRKHDAEMIRNMILFVEQLIFMDKYINVGIYSLTDTRAVFLNNLGKCLDKLRIITKRCGLCSEHQTNKINC